MNKCSKILRFLFILQVVCFNNSYANYSKLCDVKLATSIETISGSWIEENESMLTFIKFNKNGTFEGKIEENKKPIWHYSGKWWLNGNNIHYLYSYSSLKKVEEGSTDLDEVLQLTCNKIKFKNESGRIGFYTREHF